MQKAAHGTITVKLERSENAFLSWNRLKKDN